VTGGERAGHQCREVPRLRRNHASCARGCFSANDGPSRDVSQRRRILAPRPNPELCVACKISLLDPIMTRRYSVSYTLGTRSDRMPWEIFLTDEGQRMTRRPGNGQRRQLPAGRLCDRGTGRGRTEPRPAVSRPHQGLSHPQPQRTSPRIRGRHRGADLVRLRPVAQRDPAVAGEKRSNWSGWYRHAIPHAEQLYETYLKERAAEQEPPP